jgi:hypothetical protein
MYGVLFDITTATLLELGLILVGVFGVIDLLQSDPAPAPLVFHRQAHFAVAAAEIVDGSIRAPLLIRVVGPEDEGGQPDRPLEVARLIATEVGGVTIALIQDTRRLVVVSTGSRRVASQLLMRVSTTMGIAYTVDVLEGRSSSSFGERELDLITVS